MPTNIIGVMSGSSLDGLDLALCQFDNHNGDLKWSLHSGVTISFPVAMESSLSTASALSGFDLMHLDAEFGKFIGQQIKIWVDENQLVPDYIASHGHTVFHEPGLGFTTQIGSGSHIAFATGIDTITSFRNADIAAGGQGAPFAPTADTKMFPGYNVYLNLGGIANINIIDPAGRNKAWDIGPCNQALNYLAKKINKPFDQDGIIASKGQAKQEISSHLASMFPYTDGRPKGLSNETVKSTWIKYLNASNESIPDLMASTVEAIASLILNHLRPLAHKNASIFVTGVEHTILS